MGEPLDVRPAAGGCRIRLRVRPGARVAGVGGLHGGALRVSVAAPPERGRANDEVREVVARALGVPVSRVTIVSGLASRDKVCEVEGMGPRQAAAILDPSAPPRDGSRPEGGEATRPRGARPRGTDRRPR